MTIHQQKDEIIKLFDTLGYMNSVLYIDDEPQNLISFKAIFRRDFKIFTATNEKEALDILAKNKVDSIISDYRLPQTNGIQIINKIKETYPKIKAAIITAYSNEVKTNQYQILNKPFEIKEINNYLCA
jgi:DNA-binding NtrC family response regulator